MSDEDGGERKWKTEDPREGGGVNGYIGLGSTDHGWQCGQWMWMWWEDDLGVEKSTVTQGMLGESTREAKSKPNGHQGE